MIGNCEHSLLSNGDFENCAEGTWQREELVDEQIFIEEVFE